MRSLHAYERERVTFEHRHKNQSCSACFPGSQLLSDTCWAAGMGMTKKISGQNVIIGMCAAWSWSHCTWWILTFDTTDRPAGGEDRKAELAQDSDGGHLVQQRRKTRVNDGTLLNIVEANDGALPLQCNVE